MRHWIRGGQSFAYGVQLCTPKAGLQSLGHWTSSITRSCVGKSQPLYGARIYVAEAEPRNERELARALSIGLAVKGFLTPLRVEISVLTELKNRGTHAAPARYRARQQGTAGVALH
jgi:hypothetical protein